MKYLLDTNTCIQYLRKGSASAISAKLSTLIPVTSYICSVVIAELLDGALRSRAVARNLIDVRNFVTRFSSLDFDAAAAEEYAKVRSDLAAKGTPIGPNDMLIAAIALAHGLTLVTHNTIEFSRVISLALEGWQTP